MAVPLITDLPIAPSRQRPELFSNEADAFLGALPGFQSETNILGTYLEQRTVDAEAARDAAQTASTSAINANTSAQSAANFKGIWSNLSGPLTVPSSVYHGTQYWNLLVNTDPVENFEPGQPGSESIWAATTISALVTDLEPGTATNDQMLVISADGLTIIGVDQPVPDTITTISPGAATLSQLLRVNSGGTAIEGIDTSAISITDLGYGTGTPDQYVVISSDGLSVTTINPPTPAVAPTLTTIDTGDATLSQLLRINGAGTAVEGIEESDITITGLGIGTATDGQMLVISGTSVVGQDQPGIADITDLGVGTGTANQYVVINGTQDGVTTIDAPQGPLTWGLTAVSQTAVANTGYLINAVGAITLTLPLTPSVGDQVGFSDYYSTTTTNTITIDRNGHNIEGAATNYTLTVDGESGILVYGDATRGWKFISKA